MHSHPLQGAGAGHGVAGPRPCPSQKYTHTLAKPFLEPRDERGHQTASLSSAQMLSFMKSR